MQLIKLNIYIFPKNTNYKAQYKITNHKQYYFFNIVYDQSFEFNNFTFTIY